MNFSIGTIQSSRRRSYGTIILLSTCIPLDSIEPNPSISSHLLHVASFMAKSLLFQVQIEERGVEEFLGKPQ